MKVLVGCEESQEVCKAFRAKGHEAYSCDIQECSGGHPEWHLHGDLMTSIYAQGKEGTLFTQDLKPLLIDKWDMLIAFPPCTYLSSVQTHLCRKDENRVLKRIEAADFFMKLFTCKINKIACENPTGVMKHIFRDADQVIQPFYWGNSDYKRTCLWLKNLPKLEHKKTSDLFSESTHGIPPRLLSNGCKSQQEKLNISERQIHLF